ncbi:hypothetical protein EYE35_00035 [Cereibacter sphaeroides]|nr:hypothetical protein EYE35_00035 [Cereibacter sphaeroides]
MAIQPGLSGICARRIADFAAVLNEEETKPEAAVITRGLIGDFVLSPAALRAPGHARHRAFTGQTVITGRARPGT